ncbi:ATP-binding protein [Paenibacillus sp. 1001270B_150601_E10]|uniref:Dph6-related ATP pyrophosphatase n=1 Tax=Paenibacillus sp. 1001270B_150601_E10 TaxID=2787079 RepID=UPI00189D704D|nr:ATP-binding protein [Paenibacillus sp. 1001270B_150601_E10]
MEPRKHQHAKKRVMIATSGGKDATLALYRLRHDEAYRDQYEAVGLMTTFNANTHRSTAHGIRLEVMQAQAKALRLPLEVIWLYQPRGHSYADYDRQVGKCYSRLKEQGIDCVMYGDIHLEDVKSYRDQLNEKYGVTGIYPLWGDHPEHILEQFLDLGYRTVIVAVDTTRLDASYLGQEITSELLDTLPPQVDRCAEYGEFHTFCMDGPMFTESVQLTKGKVTSDGRNCYVDLMLS